MLKTKTTEEIKEELLKTKTTEEIKEEYETEQLGMLLVDFDRAQTVLEKTDYDPVSLEDIIEARKAGKDSLGEWFVDHANFALDMAYFDLNKPKDLKPNQKWIEAFERKPEFYPFDSSIEGSAVRTYAAIVGKSPVNPLVKVEAENYLRTFSEVAAKIVDIDFGRSVG